MLTYLISIIEGLLVIVPALLSVAFVTIAERKTMASMQRRLGPNVVGLKKIFFSPLTANNCKVKRMNFKKNCQVNLKRSLFLKSIII